MWRESCNLVCISPHCVVGFWFLLRHNPILILLLLLLLPPSSYNNNNNNNCMYVCLYVCMSVYVCMYVCMDVWIYACMYVCMYGCMYVCMFVWHSIDGFTSLFLVTSVFQIVSEIHSNITSNTDKIQGKHFHNRFPALSFTTSFPFPLSFPVFLHIPFLNFAFCPNSVSEENWEHVGLSAPIIPFLPCYALFAFHCCLQCSNFLRRFCSFFFCFSCWHQFRPIEMAFFIFKIFFSPPLWFVLLSVWSFATPKCE